MEIKKLEKYVVEKKTNSTDMLSSLKRVDFKLVEQKMKENEVDTIEELSKEVVACFEVLADLGKSDIFSQMFFRRLLENENTIIFSASESDVEDFFVFPYKKGDSYAYYIPDEIKEIIKKTFHL